MQLFNSLFKGRNDVCAFYRKKEVLSYQTFIKTLDIEETAYIWHLEGIPENLPQNLKQVEKDLNTIKNKGRPAFLKSPLQKFCRILHDYTDDRKGFTEWKARLEERLV